MNRVPEGKKVYIGSRKFLSGEALPPYIVLEDKKSESIKNDDSEIKTKRKYTRRTKID